MNILILNGSPKGDYSITLQTCLYIISRFPEHEYEILNVGKKIKSYEKDFAEAEEALRKAELILFAYPVYTFIVPSQLHRFIELIKENGVPLAGKFATQISTSKHFYDVTAHRFIRDNCTDMGMKVIRGLSADMDDLLKEKGQREAEEFFRYALFCCENDIYENPPAGAAAAPEHMPVTVPEEQPGEKSGDVVIVADLAAEDRQLADMINRFRAVLPKKSRLVNIRKFPFKSGCVGCFNCAGDGKCVFKDGFDDMLRNDIQTAEAIVIAFSVKDHSMGSLFKTYDDRQFCNGHRTVTMGMPFGYIISGDLSREENLRTIIDARAEVGGNFLAGTATDEFDPDGEIDALSVKLCYAIDNKYAQPANFYGIGGMKIFRDLIWKMQGMMRADHKFYKAHGQYDFPQKDKGTILKMYLVGGLISKPKIKAKMGNKMNEGMIAPYRKVLEKK